MNKYDDGWTSGQALGELLKRNYEQEQARVGWEKVDELRRLLRVEERDAEYHASYNQWLDEIDMKEVPDSWDAEWEAEVEEIYQAEQVERLAQQEEERVSDK